MKLRTLTLACGVAAASYSAAWADDPVPPPAGDTAPAPAAAASGEGVDQATLPKGRWAIDVFLGIDLSKGAVGKPITLSPDIWYGVSDKLTLGLVHSIAGETGFIGNAEAGSALCLTGTDNGCAKVYNNVGLDVRYGLKDGSFSWAFDGGLFFDVLSPDVLLSLKVGALGRWHKDKISVELQPAVFIGLTNRSTDDGMGGTITTNADVLSIPVTGFYAFTPKISGALQIGLSLPFEDTSDTYRVPLSIGVHYLATEHLNLNLSFSLDALIANNGGADARSLVLGGSYAL